MSCAIFNPCFTCTYTATPLHLRILLRTMRTVEANLFRGFGSLLDRNGFDKITRTVYV